VILQFFEELKTHPNVEYQPFGEGITEIIPPGSRLCVGAPRISPPP
jgi:hypothetical protein